MAEKKTPSVEVRYATLIGRKRPELDEICAKNADIHIEKMNDGEFFLSVETATERVLFYVAAKTRGHHITAWEFSRESGINRRSEAQTRRWNNTPAVARKRHGRRVHAWRQARTDPDARTKE